MASSSSSFVILEVVALTIVIYDNTLDSGKHKKGYDSVVAIILYE